MPVTLHCYEVQIAIWLGAIPVNVINCWHLTQKLRQESLPQANFEHNRWKDSFWPNKVIPFSYPRNSHIIHLDQIYMYNLSRNIDVNNELAPMGQSIKYSKTRCILNYCFVITNWPLWVNQ